MVWRIELETAAVKELGELDKQIAKRILWMTLSYR